jgi:hypothetical protein
MSDALTPVNREFNGDIDPGSRGTVGQRLSGRFPSYFNDFWKFTRSFALRMDAALVERRRRLSRGISIATAIMAIV